MTHFQVPERYTEELNELAQRDARPVQDVVSEAMDAYLSFRFREAPLTTTHIQSLQQGLKQAERRQLVSEETVEAFFDDWEKAPASR